MLYGSGEKFVMDYTAEVGAEATLTAYTANPNGGDSNVGILDINDGMNAFRRTDGEYLFFMKQSLACILILNAVCAAAHAQSSLTQTGTATQLIVDGKPFLMRGVETTNKLLDDPSDLPYLDENLAMYKSAGVNTALIPCSENEGAIKLRLTNDNLAIEQVWLSLASEADE